MEHNNFSKCLAVLTLAAMFFAGPAFPAASSRDQLSGKTLRQDLARYRTLAENKKLSLDDRLAHLLKIEKKYRHAKVSVSPVREEIERLKKEYSSRLASDAPPPAGSRNIVSTGTVKAPEAVAAAPSVENISIMDSDSGSQVIVTARGARHCNYFLLRGPDNNDVPAVVLDIYGVTMIDTISTVKSGKGAFSEASVRMLREKPEPVARVIAQMRESRQYRVSREGSDRWIIGIEKEAPAAAIIPEPQAPRNESELVPEVLAVPVSELPADVKPIEPAPAPVTPAAGGEPDKPVTPATYAPRTQLEQALPWASLGALILIVFLAI